MEAFEAEEQTALRELQEETGLHAKLLPFLSATEDFLRRPGVRQQITYFAAEAAGEPRPRNGEAGDFLWVSPEELSRYLRPGTVEACKELLKYL